VPEVRITAEQRTEFGKGGARRTRRAGKLPAVLYGHGTDPRHISLPTREFEHALRTDGVNVLLDVQIDGGSELALPKSIQRDPVRGAIEHVDLILVRRGERMTVDVSLQVNGDVVPGGLLEQTLTTVPVTAEATNIPGELTVSVDGLEIGASVRAGDLDLPTGVELVLDADHVVVHILAAPTAEEMEAELDVTGAEEPPAEEDEAAGEGDIVPDTESGEGGPAEPPADAG
jgi:large subunit ribosomal protein L25